MVFNYEINDANNNTNIIKKIHIIMENIFDIAMLKLKSNKDIS